MPFSLFTLPALSSLGNLNRPLVLHPIDREDALASGCVAGYTLPEMQENPICPVCVQTPRSLPVVQQSQALLISL